MLAHRQSTLKQSEAASPPVMLTVEDVSEFTRLIFDHDRSVAAGYINALRSQGVSLDTIFVDLFAASARLLGEQWVEDTRDFADVTVGLSRLQGLLHEFSPSFAANMTPKTGIRRVLLSAFPGEQHTFGVMMVDEFFRRAGWDVQSGPFDSREELIKCAKNEHFDLVGISVSSEVLLETVGSAIQAIRKASRNKSIGVMVGGNLFIEQPELVARVGADATAADGRQAVLRLPALLGLKGLSAR